MTDLTLVDFLLARITEDETLAAECSVRRWTAIEDDQADQRLIDSETSEDLAVFNYAELRADEARHAARWQPARVLAECESKRRIVAWLTENADAYDLECGGDLALDVLRLLALPYADHPDFREEWRA